MIKLRPTLHSSIFFSLMASSLAFTACTTSKKTAPSTSGEVVAPTTETKGAYVNEDVPEELKDADRFDPATTLDKATVEQSDFYQIKKSVEENKQALEAAWKEQERLESNIKAANAEQEKQKALAAKAEEEERERQRQLAIQEFEKSKEQRAKDEKQAADEVQKLPTITKDEAMWQGLED